MKHYHYYCDYYHNEQVGSPYTQPSQSEDTEFITKKLKLVSTVSTHICSSIKVLSKAGKKA